MNTDDFQSALTACQRSNLIKSTRRIFFNHLDASVEDRGNFHVDVMFGSGTGIVLKRREKFFVMTADHVIRNGCGYKFTNESPFWVTSKANITPTSLHDFLMPAYIYHVGEIFPMQGKCVDFSDLVLIEMFDPMPMHWPDHFLDLDDNPEIFLREDDFFEGQLLLFAGYPFESNSFDHFDETTSQYTHSTPVNRVIYDGYCRFEEGSREPYIWAGPDPAKYPDVSGVSGGIVTNVQPDANSVQMAGMVITGGPKIIRFIPSYIVREAISTAESARRTIVDPRAGKPLDLLEALQLHTEYIDRFIDKKSE